MKKTNLIPFALALVPILARADLPPGNAVTFEDIAGIMGIIARFMIAASMTLAVIMIVWSGIIIMTAQGGTRVQTGRKTLTSAAIGIGVVMATGVIINTIAALIDRSFFCTVPVLGICLW